MAGPEYLYRVSDSGPGGRDRGREGLHRCLAGAIRAKRPREGGLCITGRGRGCQVDFNMARRMEMDCSKISYLRTFCPNFSTTTNWFILLSTILTREPQSSHLYPHSSLLTPQPSTNYPITQLSSSSPSQIPTWLPATDTGTQHRRGGGASYRTTGFPRQTSLYIPYLRAALVSSGMVLVLILVW